MKKAFTLIELLIVIAVISILISITLPRFRGMQEEGMIIQAKADLRTLRAAIESYYIHNGLYPATGSSALELALFTARPNIIDSVPTDPFSPSSIDYVYVRGGTNNQSYVIYSVGPYGNGTAYIVTDGISGDYITESNDRSCIYFSNVDQDTRP